MKSRLSEGSAGHDHGLTPREVEVMGLAKEGMSRGEIAGQLNMSINTVGAHLKNIYRKLGVKSLVGAINELENHQPPPGITNALC